MTDAHCHVTHGETRHFLCDPCEDGLSDGATGTANLRCDVRFIGKHPWHLDGFDAAALRARLAADPRLGVGEIGLDRMREREISPKMREVFETQLAIAAEFRRPVVLHGAKCWGEVVKAARRFAGKIPAFLFHGFSRSDGLMPDIVAMNGYVSVGPAVLNDHAVNYRELVKEIPSERLLVESDRTAENEAKLPSIAAIAAKLAELRGVSPDALSALLEDNGNQFSSSLVK